MKTVNSTFQLDLIRHGHSIRYVYGQSIDRGDDRKVEIANY